VPKFDKAGALSVAVTSGHKYKSNPLCVVLDTSVLHKDYMLEKEELRELLDVAKRVGANVYFPKVVLEEHINHYNEDYHAHCEQLRVALDSFKRLPFVDVSKFSAPELGKPYSDILKEIVGSKNITIVDYPEVKTQRIMDRCLKKQKPFGGKDKDTGFKDVLIWETVLQMLKSGCKRIILVSGNHKDFADSATGSLHKDLVDDLMASGYDKESVEYIPSIKTASRFLSGKLGMVDPVIKAQIVRNVNFGKLLSEKMADLQHFMTQNPGDIGLDEDASEPVLVRFIGDAAELILIIDPLADNTALVYVDYFVDSEVAFYMPVSSYRLKEKRLRSLNLDVSYANEEADFVRLHGKIRLLIDFSLVFDRQNNSVSGFKVNEVRI